MFFLESHPPGFSEREYNLEYNRSVSRRAQIATSFGLIVFNMYLILDFIEVPDLFVESLIVRSLIVTPPVLLAIRLLSQKKYLEWTKTIILGSALLVGLATVYLHFSRNPMMTAHEPIGLVYTSLYIFAALRMRRREAFLYSGTMIFTVVSLLLYADASIQSWFTYLSALIVTCGLGIGVANMAENSWRENFMQKRLIAFRESQAAHLLEVVFPRAIADQLRQKKDSIAEYSAQVSVLFADIEGFTSISSQMRPTELVDDLDAIFSKIDTLCQSHGCEKIKTIGDAYLAVSGLPMPAQDHAERIVKLALALREEASNLTLGGHPIKFRIGIHSGPVVAGVIGKSRFSYDLWGDTVNTASRMESSAPSGSIQIS